MLICEMLGFKNVGCSHCPWNDADYCPSPSTKEVAIETLEEKKRAIEEVFEAYQKTLNK
jgi:hypothetical protein